MLMGHPVGDTLTIPSAHRPVPPPPPASLFLLLRPLEAQVASQLPASEAIRQALAFLTSMYPSRPSTRTLHIPGQLEARRSPQQLPSGFQFYLHEQTAPAHSKHSPCS